MSSHSTLQQLQQTTALSSAASEPPRLQKRPREAIIPFAERRTCSVPEALAAIPASRSLFYKMVRAGRIKIVKVGASTRVLIETLPGFGAA
jgi:hypothetical protein